MPAHILIVDDEYEIRNMLERAFRALDYECSTAKSGEEALNLLMNVSFDVVVTDIQMPGISGIELLKAIKRNYNSDVIVMTGFVENYAYEDIIEAGASDFVQKPTSIRELLLRVKRVLRERKLIEERNQTYKQLEASHLELKKSYLDTIQRLVIAAEYKDENTGAHIRRMSLYSSFLAEKAGLSKDDVFCIKYAAPMHDIGKIGIPDKILFKPGKLSEEEFETMKQHTIIGAKILLNSQSPILRFGQEIALSHHEKWNGLGYPQGLSESEIPLAARIVSLADVFDALTSVRPYKEAYSSEYALEIIREDRENHFDPHLVDIFLENQNELIDIKAKVSYYDQSLFMYDPASV